MTRNGACLLAVIVMWPCLLRAQQGERSARWGVIGSITPRWTVAQRVGDYVGAERYDISGSELSIGIVRGRDYSGDLGVAFVWKGVSEGSTSRFFIRAATVGSQLQDDDATVVAKNVSMLGVEAHRFFKLVTVRRRVQLGVNAGGGIFRLRGRAERTEHFNAFVLDAATGRATPLRKAVVSDVGGGQIFTTATDVRYVPSVKVELGVGVILTRSLKTRVSGGVGFPGYHVASLTLIYLFGRPGPQSIFR